jgi:hypothetical protein
VLNLVNVLLLANFVLGFFPLPDATLFSGMFHTNRLIVLEKNMLNLGTLIISLQAYDWLKDHRQVPEFYMLLLADAGWLFLHDLRRQSADVLSRPGAVDHPAGRPFQLRPGKKAVFGGRP